MKINNKFKIIWWLCLLLISVSLLLLRFESLTSARAQPFDYLIFVLFIVLAFLPFFAEMSLFGLTFKKELEEVQEQIATSLNEIKFLLNNTNSNNLYFSNELNEEQLKELKGSIVMEKPKLSATQVTEEINSKTMKLFKIRYSLEKELKRMAARKLDLQQASIPIPEMANVLLQKRVIAPGVSDGIKAIDIITRKAVHAEEVSDSEIDFCLSVGPAIIDQLKEKVLS
ncbi:hypothetical protein [Halobacillus sp. Marseille-Q1614]|uniref:hypothetical protein n=1 Tax=Halobacillus sp. Marseille-Q1614 TaxID=2709134 RepID=UPI001570D87F|nr:hypothetical protein [Halobacillus sp. Marseille-Q1614]